MVKELETLYYMATMPFDLRICFNTRRKRNYYTTGAFWNGLIIILQSRKEIMGMMRKLRIWI